RGSLLGKPVRDLGHGLLVARHAPDHAIGVLLDRLPPAKTVGRRESLQELLDHVRYACRLRANRGCQQGEGDDNSVQWAVERARHCWDCTTPVSPVESHPGGAPMASKAVVALIAAMAATLGLG